MRPTLLKHKILFASLTIIVSVSSIFFSGFFSNNAKSERIADYASIVAENQSDGGIFSISVENTENKGNLLSPDVELYSLYGIFKQEKITFASTINATKKEHTILFSDGLSNNLSLLYLGPTGTVEYKNHYKHYVFPVEMMFKDNQSKAYEVSDYICYLSKSQATRILDKQRGYFGVGHTYSDEDYEKLLYTPVSFNIDGDNVYSFSIINIYYEDNYYCSGLTNVMGEFIMCSYYLPMNLRRDQKSLYFMSKYSYQNQYFMNYINQVYSEDIYRASVNPFNIHGQFDNDLIVSFRNKSIENETVSYVFISLFIISTLFFIFLFIINKGQINTFLILLTCFCPYYLFKLINDLTNNALWFSSFSTRLFLLFVIGILLFSIICKIVLKSKSKAVKIKHRKIAYEIDI